MGSKTHNPISVDSLSTRFPSSLHFDDDPDKPDSKDFPDPKSPATATTSSSSGSSRGGGGGIAGCRTHSGELHLPPTDPKPGHRRSGSGALLYSSASSPSSSTALPAGNICPSGKIGKMSRNSTGRSNVLGSGSGSYGHGSVIRGGGGSGLTENGVESAVRRAMTSLDPDEVKRIGNEQYKRGQFGEALKIYDRAIAMCPENAACRSNRAAALTGLNRLGEAVKECEEAVRIDPGFGRAHQRLASLHIRLGQVESARQHLFLAGHQPDHFELQKLQAVERHLAKCADARKIGDWKLALRECDAAIAAGADSSPMLLASRAEAFLRLHCLDEADSALANAMRLEALSPASSHAKFFGMLSNSFLHIVRAQVDMALGRFDSAVVVAEKTRQIDPGNIEVAMTLNNVRSVARARARGNELFSLGKFAEACIAYGEGLHYDPSNPVLHCNRAACKSKLGQWERSVEDCNEALRIQPNYTKALLRRAASNGKLERWAESVQDYEVLRKELPNDAEVAEALFNAQLALKTCRGEMVSNSKFGGEAEFITGLEQFREAISLAGVSVAHFMVPSNQQCIQISSFVDVLRKRYPSVNFLKVDVNENPAISMAENVRIVPTFKIYKYGNRVKEMICPSQQVLEFSVKHYGL